MLILPKSLNKDGDSLQFQDNQLVAKYLLLNLIVIMMYLTVDLIILEVEIKHGGLEIIPKVNGINIHFIRL